MLVALMALITTLPLQESKGSAEKLVVKVFDVSDLVLRVSSSQSLPLLPLDWRVEAVEFDSDADTKGEPWLYAYQIAEWIRGVSGREEWDMDWVLDVAGEGHLRVVAPSATVTAIEEFLDWLRDSLLAAPELVISVHPAGEKPSGSLDRAGRVGLRLGTIEKIRSTQAHSWIGRWDLEIAQQASRAYPRSFWLDAGLNALVRAAPVREGVAVDLVLCHSELSAMESRSLASTATIATDRGLEFEDLFGSLDQPRVSFVGFAGSFVLADGQAARIPVVFETATGRAEWIIAISLKGSRWPATASHHWAKGSRTLSFASSRALAAGSVTGFGIPDRNYLLFPDRFFEESRSLSRSIHPSLAAVEALEVLIRDSVPSLDDDDKSMLEPAGSDLLCWILNDDAYGKVASVLEHLERLSPNLDVDVRVLSHGERIAGCRFPMRESSAASIHAGVQGTHIADWDVDVANNVSAERPIVRSFLDGMLLDVRVSRNGDRLRVEVEGDLNFLTEPPVVQKMGPGHQNTIDRVTSRRLRIGDARNYTLGQEVPLFWGDEMLSLEIRVFEQKAR